MSPNKHVVDVSEATFQTHVVDASRTRPVFIDFWASWCGPCKTLGPLLEQHAADYRGAFQLAKVDVDANPSLAEYFRAQSIPMVVVVFQGAVVDQFVGALPKAQVKQFIDATLEKCGIEPPTAEPTVPSDPVAAEAHWRAALAEDAKDGAALLELGRLLMARGEDDEARSTLERVPATAAEYGAARAALALAELNEEVRAAGGEDAVSARLEQTPADGEARYLAACARAVRGHFAEGLSVLVELVATAPAELRGRAKKAASTVLGATERGDDEIEALRRKLARLLF